MRVMVRLLKRADVLTSGARLECHCRAAKKRARKVQFTRGQPNRVQLYRELIATARAILAYLEQASACIASAPDPLVELWQSQVRHYRPLIERFIRQSERRVLAGEPVPASEKVGQPVRTACRYHRQGSRDPEYGHPRFGDRSPQPGRQRSLAADAGALGRLLGPSAAASGRRS